MKPKLMGVAIIGLLLSIAMIYPEGSFGGLNLQEEEKGFSAPSGSAAFSETAVDEVIKQQSEDHSTRWFYSVAPARLKGVALVIHGLNLRPDRMQPIISKLTESGIDVLALSLRGHGENYTHVNGADEDQARLDALKSVSYQLWMNEAYLAYLVGNRDRILQVDDHGIGIEAERLLDAPRNVARGKQKRATKRHAYSPAVMSVR